MKKAVWGVVMTAVVVIAGLAAHGTAAAAGCDDFAIMYCGATSASNFISKINNDGRHQDHKAVYADFGLVPAQYGKFASSAQQGVIHKDGSITVNGTVVGRSTMNIGRVHSGGFDTPVHINGNTYWGGSFDGTYHADSADVMVMFNDKGIMQFAVISSCGNPQRLTPVTPQYSCNNLRKTKVSKNTYEFTTRASASQGAQVVKAVYDFGDGDSRTVTDLSTPVRHSFSKDATVRVTVYVKVPGGSVVTTTGADCVTKISFEKPPTPTPTAVCKRLTATLLDNSTRNYRFVATAQFDAGVTFSGADFTFGDSTIMRDLKPNGNTVTVRHAFSKAGTYTVTAVLHFKTANDSGSSSCQTTVTPTTTVSECKPGVPSGSPECQPATESECTDTTAGKGGDCELTATGGSGGLVAGIFGGATVIAGSAHYLIRRRLLGL